MPTSLSSAAYTSRLSALQQRLAPDQVVLISNQHHLLYFTGFVTLTPSEREAFLLVSKKRTQLLLSAFSLNEEIENVEILHFGYRHPLGTILKQFLEDVRPAKLYLDATTLTVSEYDTIRQFISADQLTTEKFLLPHQLRQEKDSQEIEAIRQANKKTHQALEKTFAALKAGMTEMEVQDLLEHNISKRPSEPMAFPTIVAFGENSAKPHHQPSDRKLKQNEAVLIDCGATVNYYCADVTRTIWFGDQPDQEFLMIEKTVRDAYTQTLKKLTTNHHKAGSRWDNPPACPGKRKAGGQPTTPIQARDLDTACRSYITAHGYGNQFIHTTGHGVGLYIHESPSLSSRDETVIEPNMVITIEPGIYIEDKFGYRFENSILVTDEGAEELGTG